MLQQALKMMILKKELKRLANKLTGKYIGLGKQSCQLFLQ